MDVRGLSNVRFIPKAGIKFGRSGHRIWQPEQYQPSIRKKFFPIRLVVESQAFQDDQLARSTAFSGHFGPYRQPSATHGQIELLRHHSRHYLGFDMCRPGHETPLQLQLLLGSNDHVQPEVDKGCFDQKGNRRSSNTCIRQMSNGDLLRLGPANVIFEFRCRKMLGWHVASLYASFVAILHQIVRSQMDP